VTFYVRDNWVSLPRKAPILEMPHSLPRFSLRFVPQKSLIWNNSTI
jgi:hypothetical protein